MERNHSFTYGTAILENLDGLLERHTVISGQGETYNGKIMEWKIASNKKDRIDAWIEALSSVKICSYYLPLCGDSEMLSHLAQKMMNSITICDRWYYFKVYSSCFIGSEAVTWLEKELNCPQSEAIQVGNKMLNLNFFYHVVREHFFCNGYYFYRFNKVIRSVKQVKKRLSKSSTKSMSVLESRPSLMDGTGRISEQYCVCDLYPRQSQVLSQSTQNLTLLVDEINNMYSFQSDDSNLLSTSQEEEIDHLKDGSANETRNCQSTKSDIHARPTSNSSGSYHDDDWKIGSIDSHEYNNILDSSR